MSLFRKIVRAVIVTVLLLAVVILSALYIVLSTPWAAEKMRSVAVTQLSALLGTKVQIDAVAYHPFNALSVSGISVNDDNGRRALEIARISARFEIINFLRSGRFDFDYIVVEAPSVHLSKATPDSPLNIADIIERLKPHDKNKPPTQFNLTVGTVVVRHGRLSFNVLSEPDSIPTFNPAHILVSDISLHAYIRNATPQEWDVDLETLSLHERSGLVVEDIAAACRISPERLELRSLDIRLPASHLALKPIRLDINGYGSIAETLRTRSVVIEPVGTAVLTPSDFAWLWKPLVSHDEPFSGTFSADASGRRILLNRFDIGDGRNTRLEITGSVSGIGNPDSLEFNLLRLNARAETAEAAGLAGRIDPRLQKILGRTGVVTVSGSGTGDMNGARLDLSAGARGVSLAFNGTVTTPDRYRSISFDGHSRIGNLDLGYILGNPHLGKISANIDGSGSAGHGAVSARGQAEILEITLNGHRYNNITISGEYDSAPRNLEARITSDDPALRSALDISLASDRNLASLTASGTVYACDLGALGLAKSRPLNLRGSLDMQLNGTNADDAQGFINIAGLCLADTAGRTLDVGDISIDLDRTTDTDLLTVDSRYLDISARGHIVPSAIVADVTSLARTVVPDVIPAATDSVTGRNKFTLDLTLENAEHLCDFFSLPVTVIYPADISAALDAPGGTATMTFDAPYLQQGDKIIDQTVAALSADARSGKALFYATTHFPTKKGPMAATVGIRGADNTFKTKIDWTIERKIPLNGQINFNTTLDRSDSGSLCVYTGFTPGQINFGDNLWEISPSRIDWCDSTLTVDNFALTSGPQKIHINGRASASTADSLDVSLADISLAPIFETLEIDKALISGVATGTFTATSALSSVPVLTTDGLHVDSIGYNYCTLGNADVKAHWNNERKSFYLDADIVNPEGQHSRIYGDIFAVEGALDLNFEANHIKVGFMKPFMEAFTSDISGYVSGNARLFGTFKDIDLEGDVFAEDLRIKIDFTNTWYTATDSIHITPGLINLRDITIADVNGHTAKLNGWLRHDYFHSPVFDFRISDAHDFLSYNVTPALNPDWYGTVYGNGGAEVRGRPGVINIDVDMATAPHSTFTFVLSDRLDAEQYSFITFNDRTEIIESESLISIDDIPLAVKEYQARQAVLAEDAPSDYIMNIRMDITQDAELIIVMDPVGGDRIRAYGAGDMTMAYDSADNSLEMRGTYTLERGNYNFTLQDIIIKDFTIEPGSSITFKGDPYSAELNLRAIYSLNANLSDLDKSFTQDRDLNRTNVPVQALLNVTGDMRQPDITFDLRFPTLTSDTYRKVRSIISTEDMMSRQIIYLLALNRFYTPDYMASTTKGNEIFSVAASTITSQISNMLGKLSDKFSIAPNLRSDRGDFSDVEFDLALSSRLLNNRLLLNGNFGYRDKSLNTNQFIGDFDIEYLLTPRGTWRLRAYNRYNDQNYYVRTAQTTQGVGIMFRRDFDRIFPRRKHHNTAPAGSETESLHADSLHTDSVRAGSLPLPTSVPADSVSTSGL